MMLRESTRRVLEIGCGRSELACNLAARAASPGYMVGADLADSAVRLGRSREGATAARPVSWVVSDIQQIAAGDERFDTVISCETIEHVSDPASALRELYRVLRPGGRLLRTTPNCLGPFGLYRGYLRLRGRRYTERGEPISRASWSVSDVQIGPPFFAAFARHVFAFIRSRRALFDVVLVQRYGAAAAANAAGRVSRIHVAMLVCSPVENHYRCGKADADPAMPFRWHEWAGLLEDRFDSPAAPEEPE